MDFQLWVARRSVTALSSFVHYLRSQWAWTENFTRFYTRSGYSIPGIDLKFGFCCKSAHSFGLSVVRSGSELLEKAFRVNAIDSQLSFMQIESEKCSRIHNADWQSKTSDSKTGRFCCYSNTVNNASGAEGSDCSSTLASLSWNVWQTPSRRHNGNWSLGNVLTHRLWLTPLSVLPLVWRTSPALKKLWKSGPVESDARLEKE